MLAVKCEEGCQKRRPYNRQSLPWGFLFCRSPEKCVLSDRLACLENSGTLTEAAFARMKRIRSLNVPFCPSHSSWSIAESDWVCWGWCSQRWDLEVVKSFRRRMPALCPCRGWCTERVWDDVSAKYPIPLAFCCFQPDYVSQPQHSRSLTRQLTAEANVEQVFSLVGQLSEVNLEPNALADMVSIMVSIMVNKLSYKPSVKDIMDKYY